MYINLFVNAIITTFIARIKPYEVQRAMQAARKTGEEEFVELSVDFEKLSKLLFTFDDGKSEEDNAPPPEEAFVLSEAPPRDTVNIESKPQKGSKPLDSDDIKIGWVLKNVNGRKLNGLESKGAEFDEAKSGQTPVGEPTSESTAKPSSKISEFDDDLKSQVKARLNLKAKFEAEDSVIVDGRKALVESVKPESQEVVVIFEDDETGNKPVIKYSKVKLRLTFSFKKKTAVEQREEAMQEKREAHIQEAIEIKLGKRADDMRAKWVARERRSKEEKGERARTEEGREEDIVEGASEKEISQICKDILAGVAEREEDVTEKQQETIKVAFKTLNEEIKKAATQRRVLAEEKKRRVYQEYIARKVKERDETLANLEAKLKKEELEAQRSEKSGKEVEEAHVEPLIRSSTALAAKLEMLKSDKKKVEYLKEQVQAWARVENPGEVAAETGKKPGKSFFGKIGAFFSKGSSDEDSVEALTRKLEVMMLIKSLDDLDDRIEAAALSNWSEVAGGKPDKKKGKEPKIILSEEAALVNLMTARNDLLTAKREAAAQVAADKEPEEKETDAQVAADNEFEEKLKTCVDSAGSQEATSAAGKDAVENFNLIIKMLETSASGLKNQKSASELKDKINALKASMKDLISLKKATEEPKILLLVDQVDLRLKKMNFSYPEGAIGSKFRHTGESYDFDDAFKDGDSPQIRKSPLGDEGPVAYLTDLTKSLIDHDILMGRYLELPYQVALLDCQSDASYVSMEKAAGQLEEEIASRKYFHRKCKKGHSLIEEIFEDQPYTCDLCEAEIEKGKKVHDCRQCNFGICMSCWNEDYFQGVDEATPIYRDKEALTEFQKFALKTFKEWHAADSDDNEFDVQEYVNRVIKEAREKSGGVVYRYLGTATFRSPEDLQKKLKELEELAAAPFEIVHCKNQLSLPLEDDVRLIVRHVKTKCCGEIRLILDKVLKSYSPAMTDEKRLFVSKRIADMRRIEEENQISQLVAKDALRDLVEEVETSDPRIAKEKKEREEAGKRQETDLKQKKAELEKLQKMLEDAQKQKEEAAEDHKKALKEAQEKAKLDQETAVKAAEKKKGERLVRELSMKLSEQKINCEIDIGSDGTAVVKVEKAGCAIQ